MGILVDVPHGRMDGWIFLFTNGITFHGVLSIHTVGYYPAVKENDVPTHATTQMTLTNVSLYERSQTQESTCSMSPLTWKVQNTTTVTGLRLVDARGWGRGPREGLFSGHGGFLLGC